MSMIVQAKFFVGFWDLIPVQLEDDNSEDMDKAIVTKNHEEPAANIKRIVCWKEEN